MFDAGTGQQLATGIVLLVIGVIMPLAFFAYVLATGWAEKRPSSELTRTIKHFLQSLERYRAGEDPHRQ